MAKGLWRAAFLLAACTFASGKDPTVITLATGSRVGIVNLVDAEVTHLRTGKTTAGTFLKMHAVNWNVDAMLEDAVAPRLSQLGLVPVAVDAGDALRRERDDYFVTNSVAKGLPRACARAFAALAAAQQLQVLIVLAPAANTSAQAPSEARLGLPEYLRGWGFVTHTEGGQPTLFNVTQLLLIRAPPGAAATLAAREFGGLYAEPWLDFVPPSDLKQMPPSELNKLQPLFSRALVRQSEPVLKDIQVAP